MPTTDSGTVEIERDGTKWTGEFTVIRKRGSGSRITVHGAGGSKTAMLGNSTPVALARILLGELVDDANA